jgi:hypothetical protein
MVNGNFMACLLVSIGYIVPLVLFEQDFGIVDTRTIRSPGPSRNGSLIPIMIRRRN